MSFDNRFSWSLSAIFLALTLCVATHAQEEDFFGDDSAGDSFDADSGDGFEDPVTTEEDPAVIQQAIETALEGIRAAQDAEDWETALTKIDELRQQYPAAGLVCAYEQGRCYAGQGNDNLAQRVFSDIVVSPQAMSVPSIFSGTMVELGKLKLTAGNYLEAVDDFSEAASAYPSNPEAHHYLGRASMLQVITSPGGANDPTSAAGLRSALKSMSKAIELKPDYGQAYLDRGRALLRLRETKLAVEDHENAVRYMGEDSVAMGDLGLTYRSNARLETAKKDYDQAKALADYRKAIQAMDTYLKTHDINESRKPWDTPDPLDVQAHSILLARAEAKTNIGDEQDSSEMYLDAIRDCDKFLALEHVGPGEKSQGHYDRGLALRMLNRFEEAKVEFTKSIEQAKQAPQQSNPGQAYLRRGIIHFRQGDYDLALQDFDDATYANSPIQADPRAMLWIGLCHAKKGDMHAATRAYTIAITAYRDFAPAYMNRGLAHMKTGRYADAHEDFNSVLRLDANNARAREYRDAAKRQQDGESVSLVSG